jgi:hypothetical protein
MVIDKKMNAVWGFSFVLLMFSSGARAAGVTVGVGFDYFPYSNFNDSRLSSYEVNESKVNLNVDLPFLMLKNQKTVFLNGFNAERIKLQNKDSTTQSSGVDNFVGLSYTFTWVQFLNEKWKTTVTLQPGAYYDSHDSKRDIYRIEGMAAVWRSLTPKLDVALGGGYTDEFGNPKAVPFFAVRLNSKLNSGRPKRGTHIIDALLPTNAAYYYAFSDQAQVGISSEVSGGKYRVTEGAASGSSMEISVRTIGPVLRWTPTEQSVIDLSGGLAHGRRFQLRDTNEKMTGDFDLENSSFARLTATLTF